MRDKKTIMYVLPSFSTGGAEKLVIELANNIDPNKFNIHIVSYFNQTNEMHTYDTLINKNIKIHFLNKKVGLDLGLFFRLKRLIKKLRPDVIHAHLNTLFYLIPSFNSKQKKFFSIHSIPSEEAKGIHKVVRKYCFKFKNVTPIAISNKIAELTKEYYNISKDKIVVIDNGIKIEKINTSILNKNTNTFTIINVSSFKPAKDHITLLDSFKKFHSLYPNSELWLLGDGALKSIIVDHIQKNKIEKIKFFGNVSNVNDFLKQADMFLLTSIWEGFPLCLLEALAVGLPIVSTNVGGICDIIQDGYNGFLVSPKNVDQIVLKCKLIYENKSIRDKMSDNAINSSKKFDIKLCAIKHETLYLEK